MGNIAGKFTDQNPLVLGAQIITARTSVKTDLSTIIIESDQVKSTNAFLQAQALGNNPVNSAAAATYVGQAAVGTAQSAGEITGGGQPCHIGITRIDVPNGKKFIRNIKVEDIVMAFDATTGIQVPKMVEATFQHLVESYLLIIFEDGHSTGVDREGTHKYWDRNGEFVAIAEMDHVWQWADGGWRQRGIRERKVVEERVVLYNFAVRDLHDYIANGNGCSNNKQPPVDSQENQVL